ncbi:MAG: terpene cyclase/mutase family protein [Actinobacteria bacterium]|nr:terpene cyclase/mutase family protein [Actinomycetota bacterium]
MSLLSRVGAIALAFSIVAALPAAAGPTKTRRARVASHWLSHQQADDGSFPAFSPIGSTADAVVSLVAAKRGPQEIAEAVAYLEANQADIDDMGEIAKVVMALVAAGKDPRQFEGRNLVQEIVDSQQPDGRFGATTDVFSHALAMIALRAADERRTRDARTWLLAAQCEDGGWQFDQPAQQNEDEHCFDGTPTDYFSSDTDTTAYAVIALARMKRWRGDDSKNPFRFFKTRRDPVKRGWGYDLAYPLTNSNSTALVIEAYRSHDHYKNVPKGSVRALTKLQYRLCGKNAGAFADTYDPKDGGGYRKRSPNVGATIGAILGLVPRPYDPIPVTKAPPEPQPC